MLLGCFGMVLLILIGCFGVVLFMHSGAPTGSNILLEEIYGFQFVDIFDTVHVCVIANRAFQCFFRWLSLRLVRPNVIAHP